MNNFVLTTFEPLLSPSAWTNYTQHGHRLLPKLPPADEFDIMKRSSVAAAMAVLYGTVILFGTVGSAIVFLIVIKTRAMWSATNVFIASLALADVFICTFDLPLTLHSQVRYI